MHGLKAIYSHFFFLLLFFGFGISKIYNFFLMVGLENSHRREVKKKNVLNLNTLILAKVYANVIKNNYIIFFFKVTFSLY